MLSATRGHLCAAQQPLFSEETHMMKMQLQDQWLALNRALGENNEVIGRQLYNQPHISSSCRSGAKGKKSVPGKRQQIVAMPTMRNLDHLQADQVQYSDKKHAASRQFAPACRYTELKSESHLTSKASLNKTSSRNCTKAIPIALHRSHKANDIDKSKRVNRESVPRRPPKPKYFANESKPDLPPKDEGVPPRRCEKVERIRRVDVNEPPSDWHHIVDKLVPVHTIERELQKEERSRIGKENYPGWNPRQCTKEKKHKKSMDELYTVQNPIGVGGGGMVYAGTRIADQQPVAVKQIMREKVKRWEKVQHRMVPQEIALMMRVNKHRGVVKLLDWCEAASSYIIVLERPPHSLDLFDYVRERGKLKEKEACKIFKQVVSAVHYIHSRGVLHRDIKDENIVINRATGEVKLIDFGCGTLLQDGFYTDFAGTPEFYPPEWYNNKCYQGKTAAIWSLGVLLYGMVCGEIPFRSKQVIGQGKFQFKCSLSHEIRKLITWMLSKRPEDRPTLHQVSEHPWMIGRN